MDSASPLDTQIEKLSEKLKNTKIPQELLGKAQAMVSMVKSDPSILGSVSNYIGWITTLPFEKQTTDNLDLKMAKQILDKNHYGLEPIKNRILEYLSSLILQKQNKDQPGLRAPILCLVGLVGTGKTTLAYSIAESLGRKFQRIPFGGMGDSKLLRGQSRTLADAEPGLIVKSLVAAQSKNPVILLDELDRITESSRADVMGVLVELLDPEQN
ncbi:MAG: AAA family ATPase, partial [Candidatus Levyibacteriota bacterium]